MDTLQKQVLELFDVYYGGFTPTDATTKDRECMREQIKCMRRSELLGHLLHSVAQDIDKPGAFGPPQLKGHQL